MKIGRYRTIVKDSTVNNPFVKTGMLCSLYSTLLRGKLPGKGIATFTNISSNVTNFIERKLIIILCLYSR